MDEHLVLGEASVLCSRSPEEELHLGFCFSFPVEQSSIDQGKIVVMTKKFTNRGAVGADPVKLLGDACHKAGQKARTL